MQHTKLWDKLRKPATPPPIAPGKFYASGGTDIGWRKATCNEAALKIGGVEVPSLGRKSLRDLGEFCIALADQLDGKTS